MAQPFGQIDDAHKGQRGQHAIEEVADTVVIGIAHMGYQHTAAHGTGELGADDDVDGQTAVRDSPI